MADCPVIVAESLSKHYEGFQFGPVNLQLQSGYIYGVVGPNGAGKTTLLKLLMNLVQPSQGDVRLFGHSYTSHEREIKQRVGFVPEEPFLYLNMNAAWFGNFVSAHYPNWKHDVFRQLLRKYGVDPTKPAKTLSRGTRVKVELALALAHHPDLLILDEPTSGLDPLVRKEVLDMLSGVVLDEQRSVVFSTHITEDVERIADYIIYVVGGRVVLVEQREQLREQWQEWVVDATDTVGLPGLVSVKDAGQPVVRAVVAQASQALDSLHKLGRHPHNRRPLGLDEILDELVKIDGSAEVASGFASGY